MPPSPSLAILAAAGLSCCFHLRAEYRGPRWQVYLFKPLSTTLLLLLAVLRPGATGTRYQVAVGLGLTCSLVGDILLMLPRDRFVAGLASFLLAHVAYAVAFTSGVPSGAGAVLLIPLVAVGALLLGLLWPGLGPLRGPVFLYTGTILLMVWSGWGRAWVLGTRGAGLAAAGATLFLVSDALLAWDRFRDRFRSAQALIMATYVAAQALIALSAGTT